jgi:hypothetical protein
MGARGNRDPLPGFLSGFTVQPDQGKDRRAEQGYGHQPAALMRTHRTIGNDYSVVSIFILNPIDYTRRLSNVN